MSHLPAQRSASDTTTDREALFTHLNQGLEQVVAFAEDCRGLFPELAAEADELAVRAMELFTRSVRSMHAKGLQQP